MENLTADILALIALRVAPFGIQDLFNFKGVSRLHRYVGDRLDVLRVLPAEDYIHLLTNGKGFPDKYYFITKLVKSGHPRFCVSQAVQLLNLTVPQPDMAQFVLKEALQFNDHTVTYLSIMLQIFLKVGFDREQVTSQFVTIAGISMLDACHQEIVDAGLPDGSTTWDRALKKWPSRFVLRVFCPEKEKCTSYTSRSRFFCYDCLLDYEVKWFVDQFCYDVSGFGLPVGF